jgi:hypothetical protein
VVNQGFLIFNKNSQFSLKKFSLLLFLCIVKSCSCRRKDNPKCCYVLCSIRLLSLTHDLSRECLYVEHLMCVRSHTKCLKNNLFFFIPFSQSYVSVLCGLYVSYHKFQNFYTLTFFINSRNLTKRIFFKAKNRNSRLK